MARQRNEMVDVSGEVLEADLKQRRFQLWLNERSHVSVVFSESQEEQATTALKDHKTVRMNVKGRGKVSPQGKLLEITEVEELGIQPGDEARLDQGARPIEDILGLAQQGAREVFGSHPKAGVAAGHRRS